MAFLTETINPKISCLKQTLIDKHYQRKHGTAPAVLQERQVARLAIALILHHLFYWRVIH